MNGFKLTFLDEVPSERKRMSRYEMTVQQLIKSGRNVACITTESEDQAKTVAAAFRRTLRESGQKIACIRREKKVYLKMEDNHESHSQSPHH